VIRGIVARCGLAIAFVSAFALVFSARTSSFAAPQNSQEIASSATTWTAPDPATIPEGPLGDSIRLGRRVFDETPKYAAPYVGNKMSCSHCHIQSGTVAGAIPLVGVPGQFPEYRDREKAVVTFEERIEQCFQRSENGHRVPNTSPEMVGLVAYAQWLSKDQPAGRPFSGRGLVRLPELNGDRDRGSQIYTQQCAVCHGADGAGTPPAIPALWGPDAYNSGAGMYKVATMAAFVQHNMPQSNPGSLSPQQAYDVAAYVNSKPHEPFNMMDHQ
jgi:thiosulfate dehydrogenase